jgi:hypothetical protein
MPQAEFTGVLTRRNLSCAFANLGLLVFGAAGREYALATSWEEIFEGMYQSYERSLRATVHQDVFEGAGRSLAPSSGWADRLAGAWHAFRLE